MVLLIVPAPLVRPHVSDPSEIPIDVRAYTAGFVDGEACFSLIKSGKRYRPYVAVSQKFREPLDYINNHWPARIRWAESAGVFLWELYAKPKILRFMDDLIPLLICKKTQALTLRQYLLGELEAEYTRATLRKCKEHGV